MREAIRLPDEMKPSRSPIHFTNEREVAASRATIWSLLMDPAAWPLFYPGVETVELLDGQQTFSEGARFETNLAGQDVAATIAKFEPVTRIAWCGGPKASPQTVAPSCLDHHADRGRRPPVDGGDDAGPALDRGRQA